MEGSESYVWLSSQECSGCRQLRKEVDDLKGMLMTTTVQRRDDDSHCHSTYISERKQAEIDKTLMDVHHKAETLQEAYEKTLREKNDSLAANDELKKKLEEKEGEVLILKEQNTVYAADFQLERTDRERAQGRVVELEQQLMASSQRIVELEDERRRPPANVATRHQNPPVPIHREFVEPGMMPPAAAYPEHHLPSYSSVCPPAVTHHSRQSPRSYGHRYGGGYDVCDSPTHKNHVGDVR